MAKSKLLEETMIPTLQFSQLAWFPERNLARESGIRPEEDRKLKRGYLARECWWKNADGMVTCTPITKEEVDLELTRRHELWEAKKVEARNDPTKERELRVWEQLRVKDGKLITPTHRAITGNGRADVFISAMTDRTLMYEEQQDGTKKYLEIDDTVPILVRKFATPLDELLAQVGENEGRTMGFLKSSPLDQLLFTKRFVGYGMSQSRVRERFSSPGLGVKYYIMVVLDAKFPNVGIINRCKLQPTDEGYIHIPSVQHAVLQGMAQRYTQEATEKYNKEVLSKKNRSPEPVLTEKEVSDYFANPKATETSVKMMDKNAIFGITTNDNQAFRAVAESIYNNNSASMSKLELTTKAINGVIALFNEGDLPGIEKIILTLASTPKGELRNQLEKALLAVLGVK